MKTSATPQALPTARGDEDSLNGAPVEAALRVEIAKLAEWLAAQGLDVQSRADEGSRDRLYFSYGYFTALKQALALLTGHTQTLH
jgi:hypothetical protein